MTISGVSERSMLTPARSVLSICEILEICTLSFPQCGHSLGKSILATRLVTVPIARLNLLVRNS
jgi:hypothetical protein